MDHYLDATDLSVDQATELFQAHTFDDLKEQLLWVKTCFANERDLHSYLARLVKDIYKRGFSLYSGELEIQPLFADRIIEKIYVWVRPESSALGLTSLDTRLSMYDTAVLQSDPIPLIPQAVAILRAYKAGYAARSQEVQLALSGLLGVNVRDMTDDD